jgi:hypothetical protein
MIVVLAVASSAIARNARFSGIGIRPPMAFRRFLETFHRSYQFFHRCPGTFRGSYSAFPLSYAASYHFPAVFHPSYTAVRPPYAAFHRSSATFRRPYSAFSRFPTAFRHRYAGFCRLSAARRKIARFPDAWSPGWSSSFSKLDRSWRSYTGPAGGFARGFGGWLDHIYGQS